MESRLDRALVVTLATLLLTTIAVLLVTTQRAADDVAVQLSTGQLGTGQLRTGQDPTGGDLIADLRQAQSTNIRLAVVAGTVGLGLVVLLVTGATGRAAVRREASETDPLTQLGNRRSLEKQGSVLVALSAAQATPLATVMLDIDHFTTVNENYGHAVGDEVIGAVAGRLRRAVRDEDVLVRQGGEVFVALLGDADPEVANDLGQRLLAGIRGAPINTTAGPIPVTLSAGVAIDVPTDASQLRELVEHADHALFEAKRAGRDQLVVVDLRDAAKEPEDH